MTYNALKLRRGVHSVGTKKGCLTESPEPEFPHTSLRPDTEGRRKPLQPKGRAKIVVERVAKVAKESGQVVHEYWIKPEAELLPNLRPGQRRQLLRLLDSKITKCTYILTEIHSLRQT